MTEDFKICDIMQDSKEKKEKKKGKEKQVFPDKMLKAAACKNTRKKKVIVTGQDKGTLRIPF